VLRELPVGVDGVLDGRLPSRIEPTVFARYGILPAFGIFMLMLTMVLVARFRV
jgi:apolipoprotein N-acyltransferase